MESSNTLNDIHWEEPISMPLSNHLKNMKCSKAPAPALTKEDDPIDTKNWRCIVMKKQVIDYLPVLPTQRINFGDKTLNVVIPSETGNLVGYRQPTEGWHSKEDGLKAEKDFILNFPEGFGFQIRMSSCITYWIFKSHWAHALQF